MQWSGAGSSLYGNLWVDRPPLLITIFRLADRLGGLTALRLIGCVAVALVVLGSGRVATLIGGQRAARWAAVAAAGLVWVGPSPEVMERMGRKDAAREIAVAAGVPVVPRGEDAGYPVLVKAAAGGGGKGMRIVHSADDYDEAVAAAKREAVSAFGDDTMLVEKYIESGRHVEVQVFGDEAGNVVHLFERDHR